MHIRNTVWFALANMIAVPSLALISRTSSYLLHRNGFPLQGGATSKWFLRSPALMSKSSRMCITSLAAAAAFGGGSSTSCAPLFSSNILVEDHYNGVTVRLDEAEDEDLSNFAARLTSSLALWKQEGRKGIWIHCPLEHAEIVPIAKELGFKFHLVADDKLVLSQWLPSDTPSRLPSGPNHQVGVGCFVPHPNDPTLMLVVQEQTGPAAAYKLWKMPTGLADAGEDLHLAAIRELREETNLRASFEGILAFRQAHPAAQSSRTVSDLFFVCQMKLEDDCVEFRADETEIAAIRWIPIQEYCDQERWQTSPVYMELNRALLDSGEHTLFHDQTLALGFDNQLGTGTNALYKSER